MFLLWYYHVQQIRANINSKEHELYMGEWVKNIDLICASNLLSSGMFLHILYYLGLSINCWSWCWSYLHSNNHQFYRMHSPWKLSYTSYILKLFHTLLTWNMDKKKAQKKQETSSVGINMGYHLNRGHPDLLPQKWKAVLPIQKYKWHQTWVHFHYIKNSTHTKI